MSFKNLTTFFNSNDPSSFHTARGSVFVEQQKSFFVYDDSSPEFFTINAGDAVATPTGTWNPWPTTGTRVPTNGGECVVADTAGVIYVIGGRTNRK